FRQGALGDEADIGIDGEAGGRQEPPTGGHIIAVEAEGIGQDEPPLDAALPRLVAVMIDDALAPDAAQLWILDPGHEGRILHRDTTLIIEAIQCPGLDLRAPQLAAVKPDVEGMPVVVALGTNGPEARLQFIWRQKLAHNSISMPSWATSQP